MIIDFRVRPPSRSFLQLGIHSDASLKSELKKVSQGEAR
jgi:hypothetical protein